jgi:5'-deoxynucleotidase YfbR-like HD superfamily hydrolase
MNDCITTYTKRRFNTIEPDEAQIVIEDIAHALSMMTRANGHFPEFFSVGQHSIQCCREALARNYVPEVALACLLHDASEAYLADVTRPVKKNMTMYLQIEAQLQNKIYHKFLGFVPEKEEAVLVSNIDDACLYFEFLHFMDERTAQEEPVMMSEPHYEVQPMKDVEREFLELFHKLTEEIAG